MSNLNRVIAMAEKTPEQLKNELKHHRLQLVVSQQLIQEIEADLIKRAEEEQLELEAEEALQDSNIPKFLTDWVRDYTHEERKEFGLADVYRKIICRLESLEKYYFRSFKSKE